VTAAELAVVEVPGLALAKHLLNYGLTLKKVTEEFRPNFLGN